MAFKYKVTSKGMLIKGTKETRQIATQINEGTIKTREIAQHSKTLPA